MFTDSQKTELAKPLNSANVKQREQGRTKLSYVESWHVIAEANRIFGFDGWDSHTVETKCVMERERRIGKPPYEKDGWGVTYTCRVIVRVGEVERAGTGAGHGIDADLGLAHESAIKEAESDARKRALMTFGNPFGLALYDKTQANVSDEPQKAPEKPASTFNTHLGAITAAMDIAALQAAFNAAKSDKSLSKADADDLVAAKDARKAELSVKPDIAPDFDNLQP